MRQILVLGAALVSALPLFSQTAAHRKTHELLRFTLEETPARIVALLGRPDRLEESSGSWHSWQYATADGEDHDDNSPPAYILCLRASDQRLMSVTRNFVEPQDVEDLFPAGETIVHHWPSAKAPEFSVRVRRLANGALLIAMGTSRAGERTTQLILARRDALQVLMPWLAEQKP
jgi:hypothetical protein